MDIQFKQRFLDVWNRYFPGAALPITFYYTNQEKRAELVPHPDSRRCLLLELQRVRSGTPLALSRESMGCRGGSRYLGFTDTLGPNFEYFLSCGIEGEIEGERYKKSPALVAELLKQQPPFEAPGRYIVFKRWDKLDADDQPSVVVFFARPDVLSGLFALANFDEAGLDAVIAPMGSGCASIVQYPLYELDAKRDRAVLGMFDVSARPHVSPGVLTFSVTWQKLVRMVGNVEASFLTTKSWERMQETR